MGQVSQFVSEHNERFLNVDHNPYGFQCVEVAAAFNAEFVHGHPFVGNAVDFCKPGHYDPTKWRWVPNTPAGVPGPGCLMIWGTAIDPYGHVGLVVNANVNAFNSFDQNWPLNSPCHVEAHNYRGVLGWLQPLVPIS